MLFVGPVAGSRRGRRQRRRPSARIFRRYRSGIGADFAAGRAAAENVQAVASAATTVPAGIGTTQLHVEKLRALTETKFSSRLLFFLDGSGIFNELRHS